MKIAECQTIDQRTEIGSVLLQSIRVFGAGFIRQTTADMVRNYTAKGGSQLLHQIPIKKGPSGIAMEHNDWLTTPLIQVMQALPIGKLMEIRAERI